MDTKTNYINDILCDTDCIYLQTQTNQMAPENQYFNKLIPTVVFSRNNV